MKNVDVPRLLDALGIKTRSHGDELWGPCPHPDHNETRPSWSIRNDPTHPNNGAHYCFGCHFTGGPVDLVQAVLGISMGGARQWITDRGLWLSGALPLAVRFEVVNRWAPGLKLPKGMIEGPLERWVTPVRRYAVKRGITEEQRERWDICYTVDGGMGGRIIFPVKDEVGRWLSWHARTYCGQDKRYKNAAREDGYDPGSVFGMRHWPPIECRGDSVLVLTEGAIDALACERVGAEFIAATGGSDPHARQLLKLQSWGCMLVATDGDHAGDKMFQILQHALGSRVDVRRVAIPPGRDAAELTETHLRELLCRVRRNAGGEGNLAPQSEKKSGVSSRLGGRRRKLV